MPPEWKNTRDLYTQYIHTDEADWKMQQLLNHYPFFFDDNFWYWHPRPWIIKRRPLVWYPQKSTPCEKKNHLTNQHHRV